MSRPAKESLLPVAVLETSSPLCGVAVVLAQGSPAGPQHSTQVAVRAQRVTTHSEQLLSLLAACLSELGLSPRALSAVVCTLGPGSFTGLRIGLSTAKGLCWALALPLRTVSTLEALAYPSSALADPMFHLVRPTLAVLPAFRGQVFARLVCPAAPLPPSLHAAVAAHPHLVQDALWSPPDLAHALAACAAQLDWVGSGVAQDPALAQLAAAASHAARSEAAPHPLSVAALALRTWTTVPPAALSSVTPNYLCGSAPEEAERLRLAALSSAPLSPAP